MPSRYVPVTMGSPRFHTVDVDGLRVIEAWFPPHALLAPHRHERAVVAVMLEGSFDLLLSGACRSCPPDTISTEPLAERHANRVGSAGARVLVIQPDPLRTDLTGPCAHVLERAVHRRDPGVGRAARRLAAELRQADEARVLAVESVALDLLATTARLYAPTPARRPPVWIARLRERLHDAPAERLSVAALAREADVHPVHLARSFRSFYGVSIGGYVRRLRLDWAAGELLDGDARLAEIALRAGFADQSHFTRAFRAHTGLTPGRFREQGRR